MKHIALALMLTISVPALADCETRHCQSTRLATENARLEAVYSKLYEQSLAKDKLESAQIAWLDYREIQCGQYIAAESERTENFALTDFECEATATKQRADALEALHRLLISSR